MTSVTPGFTPLLVSDAMGERLRVARKHLGVNQDVAAAVVGVTRKAWNGWEGGQPIASKYHPAIELYLGVRFDVVSDDEAPVLDAARSVLDGKGDR